MAFPEKSILIVGGGIVGLCLGVLARARGFHATLIRRDTARHTASGVAAGMIAPTLEALGDPDPHAFDRLKAAQSAWLELMPIWPGTLQAALREQQESSESRFVASDGTISQVAGDWLVDAPAVLSALETTFIQHGGQLVEGEASFVAADAVTLTGGRDYRADHVVLAAGYTAATFAVSIPSLKALMPIKGHLLDLPGQGRAGVVRSAKGYLADYGASAKFGASMEAGRDDLAIDPAIVADLKARAQTLFPDMPLDAAVPRTGIRASTPDGWPLIGLDVASGVWIAAGMRRNGYVFAPFAAQVILDQINGKMRPDAQIYDPQRFA